MEYEKKFQMTLTGDRVYVLVNKYDRSKWRVVLPGDLMDITDKLTDTEREKVCRKISGVALWGLS